MQVTEPYLQHKVMIEAVQNHMPEVVIVDEIGTEAEVNACRTIAQRGVMLIGSAHGKQLENLIKNPTLSDLVRVVLLHEYKNLLPLNVYELANSKTHVPLHFFLRCCFYI